MNATAILEIINTIRNLEFRIIKKYYLLEGIAIKRRHLFLCLIFPKVYANFVFFKMKISQNNSHN